MQHHGSKAALFRSAVQLDAETPGDVQSHLRDVVDARVAGLPPEMMALVRSMLTVPEAADAMRDYLDERAANLAGAIGGRDAKLRAALAVCAILGLTVDRHFLRLSAFEGVSEADLADAARSWVSAGVGSDAPG